MGSDWSKAEVQAAVEDYFTMLAQELQGAVYNKAAHNRDLLPKLTGRTHGSVERKHQNISAVLLELGLPYIDGYKPLVNYQGLLFKQVADILSEHPDMLANLASFASAIDPPVAQIQDADAIVVPPPPLGAPAKPRDPLAIPPILRKFDFTGQEAKNRNLGRKGEEFVLSFEEARLVKAGRKDLAGKIEWVSENRGDGAGYDIASFDESGRERLIEVKTTNYGRSFPFMLSRNEVAFSESNGGFCLYRVFHFHRDPHLFMLPGSVSKNCLLEPLTFKAGFGKVA